MMRAYSFSDAQRRLVDSLERPEDRVGTDMDLLIQDEPLIRFVSQMITEALQQSVSDIHVEPFSDLCRIRYRQHGVLRIATELPAAVSARMAARLKIMAELDIAERRLPQDGRFLFQGTDIRLSTCPVLQGEKCVLRLLRPTQTLPDMRETGMSVTQRTQYCKALSQPQGMILVTGPTGSGKTVTLYAGLSFLNHPSKNIATVEDPVEIRFPGINQVNINPRTGLLFPRVLRTLLRQDPDVIMLGEIRDTDSAKMAVEAAQTGHFVLSTLHTGRASEALLRLTGMGISPALLIASVRLVIAQRLLRVLCRQCRMNVIPDRHYFPEIIHVGKRPVYEAVGCDQCVDGYTGRTAIFEFLPLTPRLTTQLLASSDPVSLEAIAREDNPASLRREGVAKVFAGDTSPSELARVLDT